MSESPRSDSDFPLPDTEWGPTREFWAAAARGELAIPRCAGCGAYQWYPAEACSRCGGTALPWASVSGRATLYSWAVVRRAWVRAFADRVPYVTGLVALEEDPAVRIVTILVDCDPEQLRIDMPMRVVFRPLTAGDSAREVPAPMFTPAT